MKWWLLAGASHAFLMLLVDNPTVQGVFGRLAWRIGPWGSFPFPYDFTEYVSQPLWRDLPIVAPLFVAITLGLTLFVAALHASAFAVAVLAHARCAWPRYWPDVRRRIHLPSIWAVTAKKSWWVWPAAQFIWLLLDQMRYGFAYGFYRVIDTDAPFAFWYTLGVCLIFAMLASHVLRTCVVDAVGPDDLRCGRCAYLLRGLERQRCPECGYEGNLGGKVEYGFSRRRSGRRRRIRTPLLVVLVVALLSAPVWVPFALVNLPRSWIAFLPAPIRPYWWRWESGRFDPNAFPIRFNAVCVVRHERAIAVVRFRPRSSYRADYEAAFWSDAEDMGSGQPPDSVSGGDVKTGGGPDLPIGPWLFNCGAVGEGMFWLVRPDATYSVEAFEADHLPDDVRHFVQNWPSTQQAPER